MSQVDLTALRMRPDAAAPVPRRPLGPRLVTGCAVLGALVLALSFAWPLFRPVREVAMVQPRQAATAASGSASRVLAEAAGWIEPEPFAVEVVPLVSGRVEEVLVLEGAEVKRGETVLARLASAELSAAFERAEVEVALRERELEVARQAQATAQLVRDQNADLRMRAIEAGRAVAMVEERLAKARGELGAATAERAAAAAALEGQQVLAQAGGTYPVALAKARAAVDAAEAVLAARVAEVAAMERQLLAEQSALVLAEELARMPVELDGAVAETARAVQVAEAALQQAGAEFMIARRELDWTTVRAPVDGVVMRRIAQPGTETGPGGQPVVALYDPKRLQARIDVPLASIGTVRVGQKVELRSEVLGNRTVSGVVDRVQRESDLLKNTMQVKVRIVDPDPLLRPETLCRARFLGSEEQPGAAPRQTHLVPRSAVADGTVMVYDAGKGVARRQAVEVLGEQGDQLLVGGDLSPAHLLVVEPVQEGERIRPREQP